MADTPRFASLNAALIRRASGPFADLPPVPAAMGRAEAVSRGTWREDLRLFATTWAAGFVFFLTFLA